MNEVITKDIPILKTFIYNNEYYCYDTYSNNLLHITREVFVEICKLKKMGLKEYQKLNLDNIAYNDVIALIEKGFFKYDFIKRIIHPETKYIKNLIARCISQLIIEVTNACNFKCRYCHQTNILQKQKKVMTEEVAYQSIDFLFDHSKDATEIAITFYGGEPLLNFELIKKIVLYANKKFKTKIVSYNMTTNASLLNNEIISFLVKNNFSLLISLDGNENIQNFHRKYLSDGRATFADVWRNISLIKDNYSNYFNSNVNFNSVVLPDENPSKVICFFKEHNIPKTAIRISNADLSGIDYTRVKYIEKAYGYNFLDFDENFRDFLERLKSKNMLSTEWHHNGPCVPAARRLFVSIDGNFYPCEKIEGASDCLIGNLKEGLDVEKAERLLNIGKLTSSDCLSCWAMRLCSMCVKHCLDGGSISLEKKKKACKQLRKNALVFFNEYIQNQKRNPGIPL